MPYAATCQYCGQTILTAETLRDEEWKQLTEHLRTKHRRETLGVRTWKVGEVMPHFRITSD